MKKQRLTMGASTTTSTTTSTDTTTDGKMETSRRRPRLSKQQRKSLKRKQQKDLQTKTTTTTTNTDIDVNYNDNNNHHQQQQRANGDVANSSRFKENTPQPHQEQHSTTLQENPPTNVKSNDDDKDVEETIRLRCLQTYRPIEIPTRASTELMDHSKLDHKNKNNNTTAETVLVADEGGGRSLGKWFPNAILVKSRINYTNTGKLILLNDVDDSSLPILQESDFRVTKPTSSLVLFYQYTTTTTTSAQQAPWNRTQLQLLMTFLTTIARTRHLGGRIRVAPEGVNATLSAVDTPQYTAQETLRHLARDLQRFDSNVFATTNTDFKFLDHLPPDRHFKEFKIFPVQELVFYDFGEDDAPFLQTTTHHHADSTESNLPAAKSTAAARGGGGIHLDAKEYHEMLKKDNTVVIDVRNHYETILGRLDGQQQQPQHPTPPPPVHDTTQPTNHASATTTTVPTTGAVYIDPKMRKSTDFKSWLHTPTTQQKLQNKTVLMYCTGGIRCERASAYLKQVMGEQVQGVYQLKGGIERYLQTFKEDGGFWRGKNFVFDKREAVSVEHPEGDGGVIRKKDKKKNKIDPKKASSASSGVVVVEDATSKKLLATCCVCGNLWDRYVGKKKCLTCGVPVLMCDKCMSLKPDKTPGMELKVRCPLCVEENVTVLANELEFTANGIKSKIMVTQSSTNKANPGNGINTNKAAESVLKWGGGHANKKKQLKKMKRRLCQFGSECVRTDCFFYHPDRETNESNTTKR